jgi:hypothetical protein
MHQVFMNEVHESKQTACESQVLLALLTMRVAVLRTQLLSSVHLTLTSLIQLFSADSIPRVPLLLLH